MFIFHKVVNVHIWFLPIQVIYTVKARVQQRPCVLGCFFFNKSKTIKFSLMNKLCKCGVNYFPSWPVSQSEVTDKLTGIYCEF